MNVKEMFEVFEVIKDDYYLSETSKSYDDFASEDVRIILKYAYSHRDKYVKMTGSILNSIFTHQSATFMLSCRTLDKLFKKDDLLEKCNSIDYQKYKLLIKRMIQGDGRNEAWFTRIREPNSQKAGVYNLTYRPVLKILISSIGEEFLKEKENRVLDFFDGKNKNNKKSLSELVGDEEFLREAGVIND